MELETQSKSSRLEDTITVVQALIKQPVREAVREVLEEERRQSSSESVTLTSEDESKGGSGKFRRFLGIAIGLSVAYMLVRRRNRLREAAPDVGGGTSFEDTDVETGTPDQTVADTSPENESDFGTDSPSERRGGNDTSLGDR